MERVSFAQPIRGAIVSAGLSDTGKRDPRSKLEHYNRLRYILRKLLDAAENMRHGGFKDPVVATYDGWALEARTLLAKL